MTTLKIIFYETIKCSVNHYFLILGGEKKVGVNLMCGQNFFHKDIDHDDDEEECYDFQDALFNFEQILRLSRDN